VYTYVTEVRRKMMFNFYSEKTDAEFSQLPAIMCYSEDSSLKAALSLAILSSETGFAHAKLE